MKIIIPTPITDAEFVSSDVPENDHAAWAGFDFAKLNQASRHWSGMTYNSDIYACVYGGNLYKQTAGAGDFVSLGASGLLWSGMCTGQAGVFGGDNFACVWGGDIYRQINNAGAFNALGQAASYWNGMCGAPNGDIFACISGGTAIWDLTSGSWVAVVGGAALAWSGMCAAPDGSIYACVNGGGIYMRSPLGGDFVPLGQTSRKWNGMTADRYGNVYACVYEGDIYLRAGGAGDFVALGQGEAYKSAWGVYPQWTAMCATDSGAVVARLWACHSSMYADIHLQTGIPMYDEGDRVIVAATHKIYESLAEYNAGNYPPDDVLLPAPVWKEIGATNRWKPFDNKVGSQAIQDDLISYSLTPGMAQAIAFLNLDASSIQITVTDPVEGVVYDETISLIMTDSRGISLIYDWYTYFFGTAPKTTDMVKLDLLPYPSATVDVAIANPGLVAKVGGIVVGMKGTLGLRQYGAEIGIIDHSRKTADEDGNYEIEEKAFSKRMTIPLRVRNADVDEVARILALYRATAVIWVADEAHASMIIYGFYREFMMVISYPNWSDCTIEIEGLT
jgi:hypothetical protein